MAIDWTAYEAFIADVKAAEASGRKWHCEWRDHRGIWVNTFLSIAAPGGQYRVVYDDPPEPENPLEAWCNTLVDEAGNEFLSWRVHRDQETAESYSDGCLRTIRVREVVEETTPIETSDDPAGEMERARERHKRFFSQSPVYPNVDESPTPNPLAEEAMEMMAEHDAAHETVLEALERQQEYTRKDAPATDQLLDGVEAVAEVLADPQPTTEKVEIPCPMCEKTWASDRCNMCNGSGKVPMPVLSVPAPDPAVAEEAADAAPNPRAEWRDKYYKALADPQPLELRVAELERELADHCHCGGTMNVTVSNDPTDPYADAIPNPLAEEDWKNGPLNKRKYFVAKTCKRCGGSGESNSTYFNCCLDCDGKGFTHVSEAAQYFVLRIDCDPQTGQPFDPHARDALHAYAESVCGDNPTFADGVMEWLRQTARDSSSPPTPNPLADWRDKYYEVLGEADRLRSDNGKLTVEVERLRSELEAMTTARRYYRDMATRLQADSNRLKSQLADAEARNAASLEVAAARELEVERQRVELERIEQELAEEVEKLRGEVARLTTQAQEWSLEAVIRRDKLNELQAYHDRREAEDRELDAAMDQVAANLPPVKPESGMLGKLRQALGMESGSIRETVDAAVDRIARLTSDNGKLTAEVERLRAAAKVADDQMAYKDEAARLLREENARLTGELSSNRKRISDITAANARFVPDIEKLKSQLADAEARNAASLEVAAAWEEKAECLRQQLKTEGENSFAMLSDREQLAVDMKRLRKELATEQATSHRLRGELTHRDTMLVGEREARQKAEQEVERLTKDLAAMTCARDYQRDRAERLEASCDKLTRLTSDNSILTAEVERLKDDVQHWRVKAECYGKIVHGCTLALESAGFMVDRINDGAVGGICRAVNKLSRRLAVYEEMVAAMSANAMQKWGEQHGCCRAELESWGVFIVRCARRCRELAGEVG